MTSTSHEPAGAERPSGTMVHLPLGRIGRPDEIASLALFLASAAASYVTGGLVVVNGDSPLLWENAPFRIRNRPVCAGVRSDT